VLDFERVDGDDSLDDHPSASSPGAATAFFFQATAATGRSARRSRS